jgi:hypothetical protein
MKNIIVATLLLLLSSNAFACYDGSLRDKDNFNNCLVEITHENIDFAHNIKTDRFAFTNAQDKCYEYSYLNRKDIKNHTGYDIEIFSEPHEKHLASEPLDFQNIRRYFTPKEHLVESCASLPSSDWSKYSYSEELIFFNKNIISVNKGRGEYYAGNRHGEYISQKLLLDFKKKNKVIWSDIFGRGSEEFEELVYEWVFENHADKNYIGDDIDSVYVFKGNFTINPRGLVLTIPVGYIGTRADGELTFLVPKTLLKKYISTKKYDYYFSNPALSEAASFDCNKASTSHEKMICNDPTLSALDGEMGRLYKQVLVLDPQGLLKEQRKFNKKYRGCSELDKCIRLVEGRNEVLEFRVKAEQRDAEAQLFPGDEVALSTQHILSSFPICTVSSSLGQYCKSLPDEVSNSFAPNDIPSIMNIEKAGNELAIETDDWYYIFEVRGKEGDSVIVRFTDDSKVGTYLTVVDYSVSFNHHISNWQLDAEELIYASGASEDAGKYIDYDKSLPFK